MAADWALGRDLVAFAGAPVAAGDELLGVLTLNLKRGRLPEGNDRALLLSFASQAAVAMRNARSSRQTRGSTRRRSSGCASCRRRRPSWCRRPSSPRWVSSSPGWPTS